ncbi:hypothetical protein [Cryptosporangium arvum]|uniref:hypothetical protein n=1 Tax=Cryptosporangium arvum TaxID=80871 RepID=UPI0004B9A038|nr:hypothetical protein [Cryptosporangium arvum]
MFVIVAMKGAVVAVTVAAAVAPVVAVVAVDVVAPVEVVAPVDVVAAAVGAAVGVVLGVAAFAAAGPLVNALKAVFRPLGAATSAAFAAQTTRPTIAATPNSRSPKLTRYPMTFHPLRYRNSPEQTAEVAP